MDQKGMEFAIFDTELNLGMRLREHECACVAVSGGSDSDTIVHMIATKFREYLPKIHFVFSNTGLEYEATKRHLAELEEKYNIKIDRIRGMPVPTAVKKYGVPFVSKRASEYLGRLQKHNFTFEDKSFVELMNEFPNTKAALKWWCNEWGDKSRFNINWNKYLKDALIVEKPKFPVSAMCCQKSKKEPLINYEIEIKADLIISGERKSEGGARAAKKGCFETSHNFDHYMPLFHWDDATKLYYKEKEGIRYSDCYEVYGLKRTGCVGCPFGLNCEEELKIMQKFEPKLYKACVFVFGESYELTRKYHELKEKKDERTFTN